MGYAGRLSKMQVGLSRGVACANLAQKRHSVPTWTGGSDTAGWGNWVVGVPSACSEIAASAHGNGDARNLAGDDSGQWGSPPGTGHQR